MNPIRSLYTLMINTFILYHLVRSQISTWYISIILIFFIYINMKHIHNFIGIATQINNNFASTYRNFASNTDTDTTIVTDITTNTNTDIPTAITTVDCKSTQSILPLHSSRRVVKSMLQINKNGVNNLSYRLNSTSSKYSNRKVFLAECFSDIKTMLNTNDNNYDLQNNIENYLYNVQSIYNSAN